MEEIWKDVIGREGKYRVSYSGLIQRYEEGHWWAIPYYTNNRDYLMCTLGLVHRIVAIHHISNPENKKQVNHKDFNRYNCHGDNLEWTTAKENTQHAVINNKKNTGVSLGQSNGKSKLTNEQVKEIKTLFGVLKNYEIALKYGVAACTISNIKKGITWQDV